MRGLLLLTLLGACVGRQTAPTAPPPVEGPAEPLGSLITPEAEACVLAATTEAEKRRCFMMSTGETDPPRKSATPPSR